MLVKESASLPIREMAILISPKDFLIHLVWVWIQFALFLNIQQIIKGPLIDYCRVC